MAKYHSMAKWGQASSSERTLTIHFDEENAKTASEIFESIKEAARMPDYSEIIQEALLCYYQLIQFGPDVLVVVPGETTPRLVFEAGYRINRGGDG